MPVLGGLGKAVRSAAEVKTARDAAKQELAGVMVEHNGQSMSKLDAVRDVTKGLMTSKSNAGVEDVMRALKSKNLGADPGVVANLMSDIRKGPTAAVGVTRRDNRFTTWEANFIVLREIGEFQKKGAPIDWDVIGDALVAGGYESGKSRAVLDKLQESYYKRLQQPTAVPPVDSGEMGPNAGPEQDGVYKPPTGPVQDLADMRNVTDEELTARIKRDGDEAHRRRQEAAKAARGRGAARNDGFDWSQLDEYYKNRVTPSMSNATENDTAIPLDQAPLAPASEYANTGDGMAPAEPVAQFPK
jgi:hypothetical protein